MTKIMSGFDYVVQSSDTIEKIAARYDCTPGQLMKFNKLTSRMLFSGQKIRVPDPEDLQNPQTCSSRHSSVSAVSSNTLSQNSNTASPAKEKHQQQSVDNQQQNVLSSSANIDTQQGSTFFPTDFADVENRPISTSSALAEDPAECNQKFLKLKVKHFTDTEGVVAGVLLVTPNCVMFDPDVMHPLVVENGPDKYSMVAFMDVIVSAALYKELPQMDVVADEDKENNADNNTDSAQRFHHHNQAQRQVYRTETEAEKSNKSVVRKSNSSVESFEKSADENSKQFRRCFSDGQRNSTTSLTHDDDVVDREMPRIHFLKKHLENKNAKDSDRQSGQQQNSNEQEASKNLHKDQLSVAPSSCPSAIDTEVFLEDSVAEETTGFMPNIGNLKRLRRSWRQRANTLGGTFVQSTQSLGGSLVQGTQSLGGSLVQGTQTIGGSLMQGTQAVGRTFSLGAKAVARVPQAVARVPQNLANISSGILFAQQEDECSTNNEELDFQDDWLGSIEVLDDSARDARRLRRQQQRDMLRKLKKKTAEMRENTRFTCITTKEEHPNLFTDIEDMLPYPMHDSICTELPYYLCIRVLSNEARRRKEFASRHSSKLPESEFGDKTKNEFWFTIPRPKADTLYAFLIQWTPDKYGNNENDSSVTAAVEIDQSAIPRHLTSTRSVSSAPGGDEPCFVILDRTDSVELGEEPTFQPSSFPASLNLNREWEIVTVEEVRRRLSLLDLCQADVIPLPDGCEQSLLLSEDMIRQLLDVLPARAQGYPWVLVYSSEAHGFSLGTLYRNMMSWHDELSPTLLIIKDSNQNVFGAVVSCPLRLSDNFYGTGESLLFTFYTRFQTFPWKNANNFIAKGNKDGLAIGAGRGAFGLWLDSDFYRGRTQKCLTFDNDPLTSDEDFVIAGVEAFGFRMGF